MLEIATMQKREIVKARLQGANTAHICNHIAGHKASKLQKQVARLSHSEQVVFVPAR